MDYHLIFDLETYVCTRRFKYRFLSEFRWISAQNFVFDVVSSARVHFPPFLIRFDALDFLNSNRNPQMVDLKRLACAEDSEERRNEGIRLRDVDSDDVTTTRSAIAISNASNSVESRSQ